MLRSSLGDLALRKSVEPPELSFAGEFSISQEYAVPVFDVCRAVVSLPFQVLRLWVPVEAGLTAFPNACFEFVDEGPGEAQYGNNLANLPKIYDGHLYGLSKVAVVGFCA